MPHYTGIVGELGNAWVLEVDIYPTKFEVIFASQRVIIHLLSLLSQRSPQCCLKVTSFCLYKKKNSHF